ncbi:hypothetical protein MKZ38_007141 [Zalerion maritima]|uniref:Uncharacterized protein n=1 Tax=Zalerion maritima TaxID=339359 RepID=A0AAD5RV01_9PEZI|nr:hypothetical protein MKZ38_007141 [Zalerion maritima]
MAQNVYTPPQEPYAAPLAPHQNPPVSYNAAAERGPKSRSFSFRSDRSSTHRVSTHETSQEKEAKRLHSKADPTLAMNEAEPSAVAAGVKSSLAPLRSIQHKDAFGNPIAEPDKSNPTRSRWERPLDTIRGFEAAIDGAYSTRRSYVRADSDSVMMRPKSCYPPRFPQESYYGNSRPSSYRPDSQLDPTRQRDSYMDSQQYPSNAYHPANRQRMSRMPTEPGPSGHNNGLRPPESNVYPLPNNHRSYETVASGGSSGGEASGYTTDPTSGSENSSINRNGTPSKPLEPINDYGINFGNTQGAQALGFNPATDQGSNAQYNRQGGGNYAMQPPQNQQQQQQQQYAPVVPRKDVGAVNRKPMQISTPAVTQAKPSPPEKRKSWFVRRFSKN